MGYDTVYVLDDPPMDTATGPGISGDPAVSSAPAAGISTATAGAILEPEPEVEPQVDVRRLGAATMRPAARLVDEVSGRVMEVSTNQSCLICYSANYLQSKNNSANGEGGDQNSKNDKGRGRRRRRRKGGADQDENSGLHKDQQAPPARTSAESGSSNTRKSNSAGGSGDESELLDAEVDTAVDRSARHRQWGAVCLETVNYIGSLRFKQLPTMVLHPGQEYYHKTVHRFSTTAPPRQLDSESSQQAEQAGQGATDAEGAETLDTAEAVDHEDQHDTTCPDVGSADTESELQHAATTRSKL